MCIRDSLEAEPYCAYQPPAWQGQCSLEDAAEDAGVSTTGHE
jgi:hypothetical protein